MRLLRCVQGPGDDLVVRRLRGTGSILRRRLAAGAVQSLGALSATAHASIFSGDTLDLVADILAWIVLLSVVAPGTPDPYVPAK